MGYGFVPNHLANAREVGTWSYVRHFPAWLVFTNVLRRILPVVVAGGGLRGLPLLLAPEVARTPSPPTQRTGPLPRLRLRPDGQRDGRVFGVRVEGSFAWPAHRQRLATEKFVMNRIPVRKTMRRLPWALVLAPALSCQHAKEPKPATHDPEAQRQLKSLDACGVTSRYLFTDRSPDVPTEQLPAIIFLGHPAPDIQPADHLALVRGKLDEPAVLIWSGLLDGMSRAELNTPVDDMSMWRRNAELFPRMVASYIEQLPIDRERVYLTGFSASGVHAWMLAYDRPELYAGVVVLSATASPVQIQKKLDRGVRLVTVVVRAEQDLRGTNRTVELTTCRRIEALNPHSKCILEDDQTHAGVKRRWAERLNYVLGLATGR